MAHQGVELKVEEVHHVARLARLELTADEERAYAGQLSSVLTYVHQLAALDTTDVPPTAHARPVCNVLREDETRPGCGAEAALSRAPARQGDFFRVPKVLDSAEG